MILTIDDKVIDEKIQYDINRKAAKISALPLRKIDKYESAKISALPSHKIDKYEYLTGKETLPSDQSRITEQAKFIYSPLH